MKKLVILFSLACLPFLGMAQDMPVDPETKKVTYSEVVPAEGLSQSDIYLQAQAWFAKTFNDANSVIQVQDKEQGLLIGKGMSEENINNVLTPFWFTVKIEAKEGRYRYEITDIAAMDYPFSYNGYYHGKAPIETIAITNLKDKKGKPRKHNLAYKTKTIERANSLGSSIKAAINLKAKSEW